MQLAIDMLQSTNVFNVPIEEISCKRGNKNYSLLKMVQEEIENSSSLSSNNADTAFRAIANATVKYLKIYTTQFSYKERLKLKFKFWLNKIAEAYSVKESDIPLELEVDEDSIDVGVKLLKLLHSRDGVTKKDISGELNKISTRQIQKYLHKISNEEECPLYIGGQPAKAYIQAFKKKGEKEAYYYTPNSIHPIVLQENVMQVYTLLKALYNYYDSDSQSNIGLIIALDIWSQLSDYAKERMQDLARRDDSLQELIYLLEGTDCPDDHICTFLTEKDMAEAEELSVDEFLMYLQKVKERKASILIKENSRRILLEDCHISELRRENDVIIYVAKNKNGIRQTFTRGQVLQIYNAE